MRFFQKLFSTKLEILLFYLLILFLPTQLGKHFWPDFSIISGIRVDYLSPTLYVTDVLIIVWFLAWLGTNASFVLGRLQKHRRAAALYGSVVGFLILNILLSGNVLNGFYHLLKFLEFSFVAYATAMFVGKRDVLRNLSAVFAVGVIGESILAIAHYLQQGSVGGVLYFLGERSFTANTPGIANASINGELILRAYGTFPHPNVLAGYLVVSMVLILVILFPSHRKSLKMLSIIALLLGSVALVLTLSRVAIFVWIIVLIGFLFHQVRFTVLRMKLKQAPGWRASLLGGIISLAIVGLLVYSPLTARFTQTTLTEESLVQRGQLTNAAASMISDSPLYGVGFGNFLTKLDSFQSPLPSELYLQPVHNIFLFVTAETGIIGLGFFSYFLLKLYSRIVSKKDFLRFMVLSIVLLLGVVDHYWLTLQQGQLLFAVVIGLCFARNKQIHSIWVRRKL